jgi:hypothetical protein
VAIPICEVNGIIEEKSEKDSKLLARSYRLLNPLHKLSLFCWEKFDSFLPEKHTG